MGGGVPQNNSIVLNLFQHLVFNPFVLSPSKDVSPTLQNLQRVSTRGHTILPNLLRSIRQQNLPRSPRAHRRAEPQIDPCISVTETPARNYANLACMSGTVDKKEKAASAGDNPDQHCADECVLGIEECAECGACDHCADGASLVEEELPSRWQKFIEKIRKNP